MIRRGTAPKAAAARAGTIAAQKGGNQPVDTDLAATVCAGGSTCQAGACACPLTGQTYCAPLCVNTNLDQFNCGECGNVCSGGAFCTAGACTCNAGLAYCDGRCVNLSNDEAHCGSCDGVCADRQTCTAGICR
ncbi:hypothetical protein [Sorangium sp. So ce388]|uniref:hypothetical protein n=1 Tax=Sorangium sp. So ce388 TaxID=3133309 RepID=UPI003F5C5D85